MARGRNRIRHVSTQRPLLTGLLLGLLAVSAACGHEPAPDHESPPKPTGPHILLIVMDTTRVDRLGIGGYGGETTPHLDRLARESTVFTNAWSPCSWTGPSHASLFTGLTARKHGFQMGNRMYLEEDAVTLAEILRDGGYRTACLSNNHIVSPSWGLAQGFEHFVPFFQHAPRTVSLALKTHRHAASWAGQHHESGERFFLFINDMEPHLPYTPPAAFEGPFLPEGAPRPVVDEMRAFESPKHGAYCMGLLKLPDPRLDVLRGLYDGEVATLDSAIGWLVEDLRKRGILDETVIIVTADHGEALGERHMIGHNLSLDRQLLRIPLLIRAPGRFEAGRVVNDVVRLQDVMPTVLEVCGFEIPDGLEAESLTGDLTGRIATAALGPMTTGELAGLIRQSGRRDLGRARRSVSDGRYHYIVDSAGEEVLRDVRSPVGEGRNLAEELPEVLKLMRERDRQAAPASARWVSER